MTVNCRSLKGTRKRRLLHSLLCNEKPDIILGTESHLDGSFTNAEIFPPPYMALRKDIDANGGDVFVAYKEGLNITEIEEVGIECELQAVKLTSKGNPTLCIIVCYRPPTANLENLLKIQTSLQKIETDNKLAELLILGDFNMPSINWKALTIKDAPQYSMELNEALLSTVNDLYLTQMVEEPTCGKNILDLVFTSSPDLIEAVQTVPGISDHHAVTAKYKHRITPNKKPKRTIYMYGKADTSLLETDLLAFKENFMREAEGRSVNTNWDILKVNIEIVINRHVPKKIIKTNNNIPYITRKIKSIMKKMKRRWNKAKKTKTDADRELYEETQREIKEQLQLEYNKYLESLFENNAGLNTNRLWNFIKNKKKDIIGIPTLLYKNRLVSTTIEKTEVLADQYESVFTTENKDNIPDMGPSRHSTMEDISITLPGVIKLLKSLDPKKAIGPDNLPTTLLKNYAEIIGPMLCLIYKQSIHTGDMPEDWLNANIIAAHKKGNKSDPANYRPISLTCVACKVMEHIIFRSVMDHFDHNNILANCQHGFRKSHSCETQLLSTVNDLSYRLDNKEQVDVAILDFAKAFDTVPHNKLLHKLNYYGTRGKTLIWIRKWLTKRHQTVVLDGQKSRKVPVKSGVPQGTVLGPLLFLVFINDICNGIDSTLRLFADDCLIYKPIRSGADTELLQKDIDKLVQWSKNWQMSFNPKKCTTLTISRKQTPIKQTYTIMGTKLKKEEHQLYLGVELTDDLSWSTHISRSKGKANRALNFIRRNLVGCPEPAAQALCWPDFYFFYFYTEQSVGNNVHGTGKFFLTVGICRFSKRKRTTMLSNTKIPADE
ncbi:PREDICTED: RNA-directed DNA polymerase from mobile element jockey-like, partial [Priapulus caudatus]|uniref:RNA-directed DNA polymerase from mobile element jockey-like n=1 Tax=Priapulus caudatus TaxID=37621 RepID=A0ABM1F4P7_PRICU